MSELLHPTLNRLYNNITTARTILQRKWPIPRSELEDAIIDNLVEAENYCRFIDHNLQVTTVRRIEQSSERKVENNASTSV